MEVHCVFEPLICTDGLTRYTCKVTTASITEQFTRIRSFKGIHEAGKTNEDVQSIQFVATWVRLIAWTEYSATHSAFIATCVEFLPWRLSSTFAGLKYLVLIDCGLKTITRKDLIGLENLISINLGNNQLTSLPNDLFVYMRELRQLYLFNNKLECMTSAFLAPIRAQLEWLNLLDNPKINVFYKSATLSSGLTKGVSISVDEIMKLIDSVCTQPESADKPDLSESFADESMRRFKKLRTSGLLSDFTIAVGSQEFAVHKNVLAINSPVFSRMFTSEQKTNRIKIADFSAMAVSNFISYVYTGEIPEEINAIETFGLAEVFDVWKLKLISEDMILRNICKENALTVLEFGILQKSNDLTEIAFDELKLVFPEHQLPEHLKTCIKCIRRFISENETCAAANRRFDSFLKSLSGEINCA